MRDFLIKLLFFLTPIVIFIYPLDYWISHLLLDSNYYAVGELSVWKDIYNRKIDSDIVIYGSSRAWCHFDPAIIEKKMNKRAYNLGLDGHNFWLQYMRHQELLKYNIKPKEIILSLDASSLHKRVDLFNYQQFLPYLLWNHTLFNKLDSYTGLSLIDCNIPLVRYFADWRVLDALIRIGLNIDDNPRRVKGYMGRERIWNDDFKKAKSSIGSYEIVLDSSSVRLFENFIIECQNNEIKLVLVYSPEYIEGQSFVKNRKAIMELYNFFAQKYNLVFLDYSNADICKQRKYFYNSQHLNNDGSKIFTNMMIKDLKYDNADVVQINNRGKRENF